MQINSEKHRKIQIMQKKKSENAVKFRIDSSSVLIASAFTQQIFKNSENSEIYFSLENIQYSFGIDMEKIS
jgi:hypothetical protein